MAYRPVLRSRRFLADQRAFAVPRNIVRTRPAVTAPVIAAVLYRERGFDVVEQTTSGPSMMRLASRKCVARFTKDKCVWSGNTSAEDEVVSAAFCHTPEHKAKLPPV